MRELDDSSRPGVTIVAPMVEITVKSKAGEVHQHSSLRFICY